MMDKIMRRRDPGCLRRRGTTIYAYKYKSDGTESDPYRLSQSHSGNIYHYVWIDKVAIEEAIRLPAGVSARDVASRSSKGEPPYHVKRRRHVLMQ